MKLGRLSIKKTRIFLDMTVEHMSDRDPAGLLATFMSAPMVGQMLEFVGLDVKGWQTGEGAVTLYRDELLEAVNKASAAMSLGHYREAHLMLENALTTIGTYDPTYSQPTKLDFQNKVLKRLLQRVREKRQDGYDECSLAWIESELEDLVEKA